MTTTAVVFGVFLFVLMFGGVAVGDEVERRRLHGGKRRWYDSIFGGSEGS